MHEGSTRRRFERILPVLFLAASLAQAQNLIMPQIADGGGWQTTLVLTNTTAAATTANLTFFEETTAGATTSWNLTFLENVNAQSLSLPAASTLFLHTPATAMSTTVGWAQLQANPALAAYAIFTQRVTGRTDQDGTSNATSSATQFLIPFDNTKNFVTSIAIANPTNSAESISAGIRVNGGLGSIAMPISLPAQGHTAFTLPQQFPATAGQSGLLELYSSTGSLSTLALRFNPTGSFTTAPVYPETGSPIITASPQPAGISINSSALGLGSLLIVFPGANGTYGSGSVQGSLLGSPAGTYSATWSSVTVSGQTYTFTGLQTSASSMQRGTGNLANITSGTLTVTLGAGGAVTGSLNLVSTLTTVSGTFTGTYSAESGSLSSTPSITFYVAQNGNDSWSGLLPVPNAGSTDGPFATLDHARAVVQPINRTGSGQINVQIRAGTYFLPATEMFTAADSGSATTQVIYQNYPGESPIFSGGERVLNWTNTGGNTWKTTLAPSTQYFETLFYNGVRRLRPRLGSGTLGSFYRILNTIYLPGAAPPAAAPNSSCSVYVAGSGWECFDRFQYNSADPIAGTWKNLAPVTSNSCGQTAGNQAIAGDVELLVFEQFSTSKLRIGCIDTTNHIVYLMGHTGISQANYTEEGFIAGNRYLVENVQDALTQPDQWFLDRSTSPWTLTYLANSGENPNTDLVVIPQLPQVLVAANLQYVTFQGITFEHDNYTLPPTGHISSELEPDIPGAVSFQNSQNITFDSGTVTQTSGTGLEFIPCLNSTSPAYCVSANVNAVVAHNVIQNSAFYDVGVEGIRIGNPFQQGDTDANVPAFTTVQNNVVEGYGRSIPAAFGIGQGMGHDNLYTHNDVYDGYHCAISTSQSIAETTTPSGIGNANNVISFNHVYNLLQGIMNDGGSIRIDDGNFVFTAAGNKILNNKIHDVTDASIQDANGYGGHGIYMDDATGLVDVENNLVYRVSDAGIYTPHGPSSPNSANIIKNNIIAFAQNAMVEEGDPYQNGVPTTPHQSFVVTNNLMYFDRSSTSTPPFRVQGGCSYPAGFPYPSYQSFNSNLYWSTVEAFATDTKSFHVQVSPGTGANAPCSTDKTTWTFYTFAGWQQTVGEDAQSVVQNPGFNNPTYPADDFSLPHGSPGVGFVVFDPSQAGRSNPVIHPPAVPPGFPTMNYNPATDY